MKLWRPEEGWDAQLIVYHTPIAYKTGEYQADRDISMVEAGADAMLEAFIDWLLKKDVVGIVSSLAALQADIKIVKGIKDAN